MEDVIIYASLIRRIFERMGEDESLVQSFVDYSRIFIIKSDGRMFDFKGQDHLLTLGIAFALQTICMKKSQVVQKCAIQALKFLVNGIIYYQNKNWKAECAFWCIFVLGKNEKWVNEILCDTLILLNKCVNMENVSLLKSQLIDCLFEMMVAFDSKIEAYVPLYNVKNGLNIQVVHQYYSEWRECGLRVCQEKGLQIGVSDYLNDYLNKNDLMKKFVNVVNHAI